MTPERLVTPAREDDGEGAASGWWSLDAITDRYLERLYAPRERAA